MQDQECFTSPTGMDVSFARMRLIQLQLKKELSHTSIYHTGNMKHLELKPKLNKKFQKKWSETIQTLEKLQQ